jgi:hypothetical protein
MAEGKVTYPIVVTLQHPVEIGSETIYELKIQRPKAKHFERFNMGDPQFTDMLELLSQLTGQAPSTIRELDWDDTQEAFAELGKLLTPSRKTTKQR